MAQSCKFIAACSAVAGRRMALTQMNIFGKFPTHGDGSASHLQVRYRVLVGQTLLQPPSEWNKIEAPETKLHAHKPKEKMLMRYLKMIILKAM